MSSFAMLNFYFFMLTKELILQEFKHESLSTSRMLKVLPNEHQNWKPHEKSMSLQGIALHIVVLQTWFMNALKSNELDFAKEKLDKSFSNFETLTQQFEDKLKDIEAFIHTTDNQFWEDNFVFKFGEHIIYSGTRIGMYRGMIMNHLIHHRGQLSVYLRLLNIPVPGLYGPSADEKH